MKTRIIEVVHGMCWAKFSVSQWTNDEFNQTSAVDSRRVLAGHNRTDILVVDLFTSEGAIFSPGGFAPADVRKHGIWASPLFTSFLQWLYKQGKPLDLDALPNLVELAEATPSGGGERGSPLDELLKRCLRGGDRELRDMARAVWKGTHGDDSFPLGTPPTLADLRRWVGDPNTSYVS